MGVWISRLTDSIRPSADCFGHLFCCDIYFVIETLLLLLLVHLPVRCHKKLQFSVQLGCLKCMRCRLLLPMIAVSVCLSVTLLDSASVCKSGWTDWDHVYAEDSCGPKEHCVTKGSRSPHCEGEAELHLMQPLPNYLGLFFWNMIRFLGLQCD